MPTEKTSHTAARLIRAREQVSGLLLAERAAAGHWTGQLSSSALSTATAATALAVAARTSDRSRDELEGQIAAGLAWLAKHVNPDGGWGDTDRSRSNLSTTALGWAAFGAVPELARAYATTVSGAERWLEREAGGLEAEVLAEAIGRRYGADRTFSAPILTMAALAGRLGSGADAWRWIPQLPFELAACPPVWFARLRLPVVSYALPALIAIGLARHRHWPSRNPALRTLRSCLLERTLRVLTSIQPSNGGFLEATPLTSFVTMSLAGSGYREHPVTRRGLEFLLRSQRPDGSWPIDTNLTTWVTSLSVEALGAGGIEPVRTRSLAQWFLRQQHRQRHPYTNAAPGGWAWTDLPGGVPDADDTAGALLALHTLGARDAETLIAVAHGLRWLVDLQNADGGIPTFCRGWGTLPFDRSSPDLTAHALRAWRCWGHVAGPRLARRLQRAISRALLFLERTQRPAGSWVPLWFGNQDRSGEENPVYGTSRVLLALAEQGETEKPNVLIAKAVTWLVEAQNRDGGWGGPFETSVEETGLAIEALAAVSGRPGRIGADANSISAALTRGVHWLIDRLDRGEIGEPAPIGFYFAKLWYYERLYPLIFAAAALRRAAGGGRVKSE